MAVTGKWFGNGAKAAYNKEIDWNSDSIKVMLCTSTYSPDQDVHDYKDDVTNEVVGAGYSAGGAVLANCTLTYTGATNILKLDADDAAWAAATITARYAVIYDDTPATEATKPLIGYIDFGIDMTSSAGTFTIQWDTAGIFTATLS